MLDGKPQCVQRQPDLERKGNRGGDNEHVCEHKPNGGKRRAVDLLQCAVYACATG